MDQKLQGPKFEKFKRKKTCLKDRFRTEFDARKRGAILNMRSYKCFHCNGWHLTSRVTKDRY